MPSFSLKPLLPGKTTVGILGGGQLGRMLALVAKRMGYRVCVFSDEPGSPATQVVDKSFVGSYTDQALLDEFANECDVVTYEFENIPVESCRILEERVAVRPNSAVLFACQHRIRERELLEKVGVPVARYAPVASDADIERLPKDFPFPAILKTASFGYDGKGQRSVANRDALRAEWKALKERECLLEERLTFSKEFSVIVARNQSESVVYGPIENHHVNHILDVSNYPSAVPEHSAEAAKDHAKRVGEFLDVQGVITIEFFLLTNGAVVANEIAPRPHNSGHLTIEGFATSQFEQQLRGVCGLPLGSNASLGPAVMVNLLGELWDKEKILHSEAVLRTPGVYLHLYGKAEPRAGRKMGHVTVVGSDVEKARATALRLRQEMQGGI